MVIKIVQAFGIISAIGVTIFAVGAMTAQTLVGKEIFGVFAVFSAFCVLVFSILSTEWKGSDGN